MPPPHSEERLNSYFINQIKGYAIFATDTKGIIVAWNEGAERLKGYTEKEIIGEFYGILHPDPYQEAGLPEKELEIALRKGVYENEDWRKRKDGTLFWATVTLTPIFSDEGQHIGFTKITGDITSQKELQDRLAERQQIALEQTNQELQKTNLDLDNFIYTASHDLRAPIINIEGLMAILKDELITAGGLTPPAEEVLQRVTDSVNRFKRTIEDLTEISRLQKDGSDLESVEIVNVKQVYEDIMADLGFTSKPVPCFINTDFAVNQLSFSQKNFRSILYNLVSNAIKYRSPDRPCIIHIQTRLKEPYVVLGVKDNGLGMKETHQKHLFTMFKRFHDHVEGTGVGLYMVKRIIENNGGKIKVKSKEDIGTEFKVYLKTAS
jgi:PAS domain S-box-containing protein